MNDFSDLNLLCVYCFDALSDFLKNKNLDSLPKLPESYSEVYIFVDIRKNTLYS